MFKNLIFRRTLRMSFFFSKTEPELTLGLSLTKQRDDLLAERAKRWDLYFKDFSSTFLVDLKAALKRDLIRNPERTKFTYVVINELAELALIQI